MELLNKKGLPTAYGFACGYVQSLFDYPLKKELYKEHTIYHVRVFNAGLRVLWESFETLAEALKFYNLQKM